MFGISTIHWYLAVGFKENFGLRKLYSKKTQTFTRWCWVKLSYKYVYATGVTKMILDSTIMMPTKPISLLLTNQLSDLGSHSYQVWKLFIYNFPLKDCWGTIADTEQTGYKVRWKID